MKDKRALYIVVAALVLFAVTLRLLPHPSNFAPLTALAIFSGSVLPRRVGIWVPFVAAVLSDAIIGFYGIMPVVWGCYLFIAFASSRWLKKPTLFSGLVSVVSASVFFFIVTNFAVWLFDGMYAHTLSGLSQCFALALPFFRNSLLGDLIYTTSLFGLYAMARELAVPKHKPAKP